MTFFIVLILWLVFAICVGAAASERGREGVGWFSLALLFSPLLVALLLIVFPNLKQEQMLQAALKSPQAPPRQAPPPLPPPLPTAPQKIFEPDGIFAGVPYRVMDDGSINAIMQGAIVMFRDFDKFTGAFDRDARS
jgi:hypothetical protein